MRAHRTRITIPEDRDLRVRLPSDFPSGEAEVIVLAEPAKDTDVVTLDFNEWLDALLSKVPDSPTIPLEALRRENLYD